MKILHEKCIPIKYQKPKSIKKKAVQNLIQILPRKQLTKAMNFL